MFLHLGVDTTVPLSSIVAILDIKTVKSKNTAECIENLRQSRKLKVIDISGNDAKSLIITEEAVYFSTISSLTLNKRAANIFG